MLRSCFPYGQSVLIIIPFFTCKVEVPNETAWFKFHGNILVSESLMKMVQISFDLENLQVNCRLIQICFYIGNRVLSTLKRDTL